MRSGVGAAACNPPQAARAAVNGAWLSPSPPHVTPLLRAAAESAVRGEAGTDLGTGLRAGWGGPCRRHFPPRPVRGGAGCPFRGALGLAAGEYRVIKIRLDWVSEEAACPEIMGCSCGREFITACGGRGGLPRLVRAGLTARVVGVFSASVLR